MNLLLARLRRDAIAALTPKRMISAAAIAGGIIVLLYAILPHLRLPIADGGGHWQSPFQVIMLGLIIGSTYGLLAAGLVLVYRTNRIINFAHAQIGAFAAAFFGIETFKWHIPYWVAFLPALAVAGVIGGVTEVAVVRRLRKAPAIMSLVATVGVGEFLVLLSAAINSSVGTAATYPQPSLLPHFQVGALYVSPAYFGMLVGCPIIVMGVGAFLKFSRTGLAMRAASSNSEAARMSAIFSSRMSSLAWALAGVMAAYVEIMTQPTLGFTSISTLAPKLLLISLAAAVLARMQSMPIAFIAGVAIGVGEQLFNFNYSNQGLFEAALFVVIVVTLMLQRQRAGRAEPKGSWSAVQAAAPLPLAIRQVRSVRMMAPALLLVVVLIAAILPPIIGDANSVQVTGIFGYMIVGLSIGIITGLGGELSLGQYALAAVGAWVSYEVSMRTGNFFLSFFYAGLATSVVAMIVSAPAFKAKGLLLTVTTLGFSLVVPDYLLQKNWIFGLNGVNPGSPILFGHKLNTGNTYYYVGLFVLLLALLIARNVRSGGIGRRLVAVRDNEDAARAFTVPSRMVKLQGFALAGFIAGLGGALYCHSLSTVSSGAFTVDINTTIVVQTVIGGLGLLTGPLIGIGLIGAIGFLNLGAAGLATTSFGQLIIIMYLPQGLGSLVTPLRDRLANFLARRAGVDVDAAYSAERGFSDYASGSGGVPEIAKVRAKRRRSTSDTLLEVTGLKKSFGGIKAVRGVNFEVKAGETLGLIGPNGAGKTTTFELLAGFTRADEGSVVYAGQNVTALGPEARGKLGLIRSFQDAALFPTLTVLECVQLSLERTEPTKLIPALLGLRGAEKRKLKQAEELLAWMGLERYRSSQIQELSTGTRRITEIACLVALQPQLLLLDEPSSGVAQRETEALGALLVRLKKEFDLTLIIIEHDIPLIMGLSDRIICMADGEVIAAGSPDVVRNDPAVVEAYLGGSITAIERSIGTGTATVPAPNVVVPKQPKLPDLESLGDFIPGIGATKEKALLGAFGSLEGIRAAGYDELTAVPGIGPGTAARIQNSMAAHPYGDRGTR